MWETNYYLMGKRRRRRPQPVDPQVEATARLFGVTPRQLEQGVLKQDLALGEPAPYDVWQARMNDIFYENPGSIGNFFEGFGTSTTHDYRVGRALAKRAAKRYSDTDGELREAEFGCGWGNLGETYLTALKELAPDVYGRNNLTLTDASKEMALNCVYNTSLLPHVTAGRARVGIINAVKDLKSLGELDAGYSHELGDDLGTTTMVVRDGKIMELVVKPVLRKGIVIGEHEGRHKYVLGDPKKLAQLMRKGDLEGVKNFELGFQKGVRYDTTLAEPDWDRIPYPEVVREFVEGMGEGVYVGVNVGFLTHLMRFHKVLKDGGVYAFSDYGWGTREQVGKQRKPQVRKSMWGHLTGDMNFPLTLEVAKAIGYDVKEFMTQRELVSEAFGEQALILNSALHSHPDYREGPSDNTVKLMDDLRDAVAPHYTGLNRDSKARRYFEFRGREERGYPIEKVLADVRLSEQAGIFKTEPGIDLYLGSYLLRSELEPAYDALKRKGFNADTISRLLKDDPYGNKMKYVELEKSRG